MTTQYSRNAITMVTDVIVVIVIILSNLN